jgi:hypothetical protein
MRRLVRLFVLGLVGACHADPGTAVHPERSLAGSGVVFHAFVAPDSTRPNRDMASLAVLTCRNGDTRGSVVWEIERARGDKIQALRIPYGATPRGWTVVHVPEPLVAGCYEVRTFGGGIGGSADFTVGPSGELLLVRSWP